MHRNKKYFYTYSLIAGFALILSTVFLLQKTESFTNSTKLTNVKSPVVIVNVKELSEMITSYDFGILKIGESKTQNFAIKNTGKANLEVTEIKSSDPQFVTTQAKKKIVPPGGYTLFDITFTPKLLGQQSSKIVILNNDEDESEFEFKVTGGDPEYGKSIENGKTNDGGAEDLTKSPEIEVLVN